MFAIGVARSRHVAECALRRQRGLAGIDAAPLWRQWFLLGDVRWTSCSAGWSSPRHILGAGEAAAAHRAPIPTLIQVIKIYNKIIFLFAVFIFFYKVIKLNIL